MRITTVTDKRCENVIMAAIKDSYPEHAILAEESGASGKSKYRWLIDPLDGTVNFYYGIPIFCTSIGLEVEGEHYLGVIYDPNRDELFAAKKGKGATLNGKPIRVNRTGKLSEAIMAVGFMKDDETIDAALKTINSNIKQLFKVRCLGSAALDMAYVAAGRFSAYYECKIRDWDIAAGRAILLEAGGTYEESRVDDSTVRILATNGLLQDELRGRVACL